MYGTVPYFQDFPAIPHALLSEKLKEAVNWNMLDHDLNPRDLPCLFDEETTSWTNFTIEPEMRCFSVSNHSSIVFVDLPYFITRKYVSKVLARALTYGHDYENELIFDEKTVSLQIEPQIRRLKDMPCDNCVYNDVQKELSTNGSYYAYNIENLRSISSDGSHLSVEGLGRLKKLYQERIEQFLKIL
ncbi:unnamed protein product [Caenorhabditis auriculariae]|uniref:SGNH domain-containing protein n=1 Tax=Caenorhabditis auriculariae TaxID=2777116 RepID=A0A8S1H879_9PELO|nr:unnamed protein product [Caenorhabditis auriculariae]